MERASKAKLKTFGSADMRHPSAPNMSLFHTEAVDGVRRMRTSLLRVVRLVGGEGGAVTETLGAVLGTIASLAQDISANISEVSRFEGLLAARAAEAVQQDEKEKVQPQGDSNLSSVSKRQKCMKIILSKGVMR